MSDSLSAASVLVVDDDPIALELVCKALSASSTRGVLSFDDPTHALDFARAGYTTIDAVITDVEVPTMSGVDFSGHLRASFRFAFTPVVVVTSHRYR